jgi:Uma2 family endonuclease
MAIETHISNDAYERLALAEPDRKWELRDGVLREKPGMTYAHNTIEARLGILLGQQLDWEEYEVRIDAGRVHRPTSTYFIPDIFVFPKVLARPFIVQETLLEVYDQPLPLVIEVWSRSTGTYAVAEKLAVYKQRGDLEVWYIHPYEKTLTAWRRQPDGMYSEETFRDGVVTLAALPDVAIDLNTLFGY